MQYDVTVSNEGDIDAKLDKITVPESTNPAIGFEVTGIEEGSLLEAKQTAILTVTVKYNDVTEQPTDLTADLEVTLDYSQAPEGYVPPVTGPSIGGQPVEIVDSGDGLYEDTYESGRYVYKGANPNNYIEFDNGEVWRIIAKEADGTYKLLKNELLP
ncbi:unknown [Firmicutes bacterium CAG:822]|nr:unknown [Firmicutes bacterium CAG:822]